MALSFRSEAAPQPQLVVPHGRPNLEDGRTKDQHQVRFWSPSLFSLGKVEVVIRSDNSVRKSGKLPELVQEVGVTVEACRNPDIRAYYAALGTTVVEQVSPRAKVALQEVTLPNPSIVTERLKRLTGLHVKQFYGELYPNEQFFQDIQDKEEPGITASSMGIFAVHDYLAHDAPAWGMTPQPVIGAMGVEIGRRIAAGEPSDTVMYAYDQAMGSTQYGAMVLGALSNERQSSTAKPDIDWTAAADHLNRFAGRAVVSPLIVETHVHEVLDAAHEFVASGQAAEGLFIPGY